GHNVPAPYNGIPRPRSLTRQRQHLRVCNRARPRAGAAGYVVAVSVGVSVVVMSDHPFQISRGIALGQRAAMAQLVTGGCVSPDGALVPVAQLAPSQVRVRATVGFG